MRNINIVYLFAVISIIYCYMLYNKLYKYENLEHILSDLTSRTLGFPYAIFMILSISGLLGNTMNEISKILLFLHTITSDYVSSDKS